MALKTVNSGGERPAAPDMSHRSLPAGTTSPRMNCSYTGSISTAISAKLITPGKCT
eukprot:CAMPEP_0114325438 /NCGR_PEP_ID=MMETSP0059-20121206/29109_1 /TAXON_ID=36894 /ORGANISM="Pyramimonas parkeae, Strain CCMP726" /LENGTH=55 /DNA_ID=CAMNT_0001454181 /DNA_START=310 /DNA_END=477 /DNA_ORIENTATION=+